MKLSDMQANSQKLVASVMRRYQDVKALDGNGLFDKNDQPGVVDVKVDEWTSQASFDAQGNPLSFKWESYVPLERNREDEAYEIRHTYAIENKDGQQIVSYNYSGPDGHGGGFHTTETERAILDASTKSLIDYESYFSI